MLAILRKLRARGESHGIGTNTGLSEGIGGDPFTRGQFGQIFAFLFLVTVEDDGQGADGGMRSKGDAKRGFTQFRTDEGTGE